MPEALDGLCCKGLVPNDTQNLGKIAPNVRDFLRHAVDHPGDSFLVTAIGCGLAGLNPQDILPMFEGATENVFLSAKLLQVTR